MHIKFIYFVYNLIGTGNNKGKENVIMKAHQQASVIPEIYRLEQK